LMSQKLSTTRQMIKKKQEMKNSESITEYINVDHYHARRNAKKSATMSL
jgi:methylphosphotriester-DNA--protein-cysteine methyltransferase